MSNIFENEEGPDIISNPKQIHENIDHEYTPFTRYNFNT